MTIITQTNKWDAKKYIQFLDLRTKPAKDLLFAIPENFSPNLIYDLGCGPGNSTILLKDRWKDARVIGLDSSPGMLKEAQSTYPDLEFIESDFCNFIPPESPDCIFSNAALQWVDEHEILIPKLLNFLKPSGILAIQMPNNFHCPSHQVIVRILKSQSKWTPLLKLLRYGFLKTPLYNPLEYYEILSGAGASQIQIWETAYVQELDNHQAVFNWVQGTGLRPILTQLDQEDQKTFEALYVSEIAKQYPTQSNGKVLLPFRRLFMTAHV